MDLLGGVHLSLEGAINESPVSDHDGGTGLSAIGCSQGLWSVGIYIQTLHL
jgi:hypothetical protein